MLPVIQRLEESVNAAWLGGNRVCHSVTQPCEFGFPFPKLSNPINSPLQIGLLGLSIHFPRVEWSKVHRETPCESRVSVNRSGTELLKIWLCLYSPLCLMDSLLELLKNWASPLIWPLLDLRSPKVSLQLINSEVLRVYCRRRQKKSSCKDWASQDRLL